MLISLNTSTLRGHKLPITQIIDIAAKTGFQGIEPWPDDIEHYVQGGGTLKDLRKRLKDNGLAVTGAIAFSDWMVDDETKRAHALEETKRTMDTLSQIGGTHMAAPPHGDVKHVDLLKAAERYHAILALSDHFGVIPALEIWGFAENIFRLGQAAMVALEAHHPKACILADVYHLYKGGSGFAEVRQLNGSLYGGFHMNDIPRNPPPLDKIADADRVYPGDGIAPLKQLFRDLRDIHYTGPISVELFNPHYYQQDPTLVAKTAIDKTKAVIDAAFRD